jgi:3-hydroxyisobutyrate dehydrogenase
MAKVAFLGLGVMGYPMAGHLKVKGGHEVTVYNRTAAKAEKWVAQFGGKAAGTPKAAAQGQDFVMCCVGNDNDLREVTLGANGAFAGVKKGAVFVDHTTASAEIARELYAEAKKRGFDAIDAPVSGGQAGAENGVLTVMCGGDPEPYARAEKVIAAYARMCKLLGGAGSGQLTKMVNQICIAGLVQGLAEGIHFAKKAGLDVEAVIETISKGAAQSWQMENRYNTMAAGKFDFGFAVDWMRKDLSNCAGEARKTGASLTAGHRRVDEGEPALLGLGVELARNLGRGGGVVDEDRALAHAGEGAVGPERHFAQVVVVADAAHDEVLAVRGFLRRLGGLAAKLGGPFLGLGGGAVIDRHLVAAFVLEMPGHGVAHDAQAQKRNLRHIRSPLKHGPLWPLFEFRVAIGHCRGPAVNYPCTGQPTALTHPAPCLW